MKNTKDKTEKKKKKKRIFCKLPMNASGSCMDIYARVTKCPFLKMTRRCSKKNPIIIIIIMIIIIMENKFLGFCLFACLKFVSFRVSCQKFQY